MYLLYWDLWRTSNSFRFYLTLSFQCRERWDFGCWSFQVLWAHSLFFGGINKRAVRSITTPPFKQSVRGWGAVLAGPQPRQSVWQRASACVRIRARFLTNHSSSSPPSPLTSPPHPFISPPDKMTAHSTLSKLDQRPARWGSHQSTRRTPGPPQWDGSTPPPPPPPPPRHLFLHAPPPPSAPTQGSSPLLLPLWAAHVYTSAVSQSKNAPATTEHWGEWGRGTNRCKQTGS